MTYYRANPCSLNEACYALEDLTWQSLETLAKTIESARKDGKISTTKPVTGEAIREAVRCCLGVKKK